MKTAQVKLLRAFLDLILAMALGIPADCIAADHVVSKVEIQKEIMAQARARQENALRVHDFFASEPAARALANAPFVRDQVQRAVAHLDAQELDRLASKISKVQDDFAAGALTTQQLTYIVIALATAVIILIIVEH